MDILGGPKTTNWQEPGSDRPRSLRSIQPSGGLEPQRRSVCKPLKIGSAPPPIMGLVREAQICLSDKIYCLFSSVYCVSGLCQDWGVQGHSIKTFPRGTSVPVSNNLQIHGGTVGTDGDGTMKKQVYRESVRGRYRCDQQASLRSNI